MFVKILLNYILGYVKIRVESVYIERFINICISKRILLWNTRREKSTILHANIGIREYKKLREVSRKTKSRVSLQAKRGIPFLLHRYRKRRMFFCFLLLILVLLWISSNFIWNVEVVGNVNISEEELIAALEEEGLGIGIRQSNLDKTQIINNIRLNMDDIAWIGINVRGTNAIVQIRETIPAPEIVREDEYTDIVSDREGIITRINVRNGTANIEIGDIVREGDVLVRRNNRREIHRAEACT